VQSICRENEGDARGGNRENGIGMAMKGNRREGIHGMYKTRAAREILLRQRNQRLKRPPQKKTRDERTAEGEA